MDERRRADRWRPSAIGPHARLSWPTAWFALAVFSCSSLSCRSTTSDTPTALDGAADDGGMRDDAGNDGSMSCFNDSWWAPATPADGGGWCCGVGGPASNCAPNPLGGWSETREACCARPSEGSDQTYLPFVDDHGCTYLVHGCPCGVTCSDDAGVDAADGGGIDAPDAAHDATGD